VNGKRSADSCSSELNLVSGNITNDKNGSARRLCIFCVKGKGNVLDELDHVYAVEDEHPVTPRHFLVVTKRHTRDFFSMTAREKREADKLLVRLRDKIVKSDPSVEGFNIGINCGEAAGQTVMHAHIHLIPRRHGDISNPRGGVRGVIPDRMSY
jgi:diadenosine tetraphosphate (Ap4A) HIT family hydrolase